MSCFLTGSYIITLCPIPRLIR